MKRLYFPLFILTGLLFSCDNDEDNTVNPSVQAPATYSFERNGQSTVSFTGQTARILMAEELIDAMLDFSATDEQMLEMFRNETASGGDANPFSNADLNAEGKNIKGKVAASYDFFSANTTEASQIRADFETWIRAQYTEVAPNRNSLAAPGVPGQLADGSSIRYVNAQGLEYDQAVTKGLIGALMADQMANHYLSSSKLDEGNNRANNDADETSEGQPYTTMEHYWDEAYGYAYGTSIDPANPNATIGGDDSFVNKYIARQEGDPDFAGTAQAIFEAFKLGRAAIVAKDYSLRDQQAEIIRAKLAEIIAVRAVYYLQIAKTTMPDDRSNFNLYGEALHDLSEGYGFIYSLRFARRPNSNEPYFTRSEVDALLADLMGDGPNGLWDVTNETLDDLSDRIAAKFDFTVEQAGS